MSAVGADFEEVLAEAQRLGYAEADPTADTEAIKTRFYVRFQTCYIYICQEK